MPVSLSRKATTDQYQDTVLGGGNIYASGALLIANNPVSIIVQTGRAIGEVSEFEYPYVNPNAIPLVAFPNPDSAGRDPDFLIGVKIKSAIPGTPAQVAGWLIEPNRAGLAPGTQFTGTISSTGQIVTGGALLTGTVNADGSIASGSGFTVTKNGTGDYTVNFNTAYSAPPVVVCQTIFGIGGSATDVNSLHAIPAVGSFRVHTWQNAAAADLPFQFLVSPTA